MLVEFSTVLPEKYFHRIKINSSSLKKTLLEKAILKKKKGALKSYRYGAGKLVGGIS